MSIYLPILFVISSFSSFLPVFLPFSYHCQAYSWSQFSSVQSLSSVIFSVTPWNAAYQASLSITNSQSLLKLMSIESLMPSNHPILLSPSPPAFNLFQHQGLFQ